MGDSVLSWLGSAVLGLMIMVADITEELKD